MKFGIVPLKSLHQSFHHNPRFQLFPNFTLQSLFWCLSNLHLSARELPTILPLAISPLSGEDATLVIMYDCCYDFYLLHYISLIVAMYRHLFARFHQLISFVICLSVASGKSLRRCSNIRSNDSLGVRSHRHISRPNNDSGVVNSDQPQPYSRPCLSVG